MSSAYYFNEAVDGPLFGDGPAAVRQTASRLMALARSWRFEARVLLEDEEGVVIYVPLPRTNEFIEVYFRWNGEHDLSHDRGIGAESSSVDYLENTTAEQVFRKASQLFQERCLPYVVSNPSIIEASPAISAPLGLWDTFTEEYPSLVWSAHSSVGLESANTFFDTTAT